MNYEQKYKEALKRARDLHDNHPLGQPLTWMTCEKIFPELRESEDEKIRKELIERFNWELKGAEEQDAAGCSRQKDIAMFKRGIAWLEKQGEQKPADKVEPKFKVGDRVNLNDREDEEYNILTITSVDIDERCYICHQDSVIDFEEQDLWHIVEQKPAWSEEDEKILNEFIESLRYCHGNGYNKQIDWLKSLKDRVQPQPKKEWSEEDKKMLEDTISCLSAYKSPDISKGLCYQEQIDWLKSLKPNHWKPSEQNIKDLYWCADLFKDKMGVGFHRLQVFIDELKNL